MGHTNSTTNYALPQFLTTDKPAWLTDINGAMSSIDTAIHNAKTAADGAASTAATAALDASTALGNASTADSKAGGALASIAVTFQTTDTYEVGDLVIYNNLLYKCIADVTTPGAWTGNTNWSRIDIDTFVHNQVDPINTYNEVSEISITPNGNVQLYASSKCFKSGHICTFLFAVSNTLAGFTPGSVLATGFPTPAVAEMSFFVGDQYDSAVPTRQLYILPDGGLRTRQALTSGTKIYGCCTYLTTD